MKRNRVRIRFRKEGDLRLIGHLDLVRAFERVFRRCQLELRMTEGFHPKPKMHFALALGLGVEGAEEVAEIELTEPLPAEEILTRLRCHAPPGLNVEQVILPDADAPKLRISGATYEITAPEDRMADLPTQIANLLSSQECVVERPRGKPPIDLFSSLTDLELSEGTLRMKFKTIDGPAAGPRDVLNALGLGDLEEQGRILKRTRVEIAS